MLMWHLKLIRSSVLILLLFTGCSHPFCEEIKIIEPLPSGPQTIIFRPGPEGKDATISSYYPDSSFAAGESLNLIAWTITRNRILEKFYIDFDLSTVVPDGAKVTSAVLNLSEDVKNTYLDYHGHVSSPDSGWKVNIVTSPWEENSISWFNQPTLDQSELSVEKGPIRYTQKYSVNITTYVQGKLKKDSNVKGLSFDFYQKVNSINDCLIRFCSSDHQSKELRPELIIHYEMI
jgi:hypothetical protein